MIAPMIHAMLTRDDLARLVAEIARIDPAEGRTAERRLQAGDIDALLDAPVALDAVLGLGGTPAPLPLTLLWYVPVRSILQEYGEDDIELADYTATLPVAFVLSRANRRLARGDNGIASWWRSIETMPEGTVARGERAADTAALALWWAGCFPEWVARRGGGTGMIRAYVTFATQAFGLAAKTIGLTAPGPATLYAKAANRADAIHSALSRARADYLGRDAHTGEGRLDRLLSRLSRGFQRGRRSLEN